MNISHLRRFKYNRLSTTFTLFIILFVTLNPKMVQPACAVCDNVDTLLKRCNTSLAMDTWPGKFEYQPTEKQAPCACNQNYYGLALGCMECQTSDTATYTIAPLDKYKSVCEIVFHRQWSDFYVPPPTSTTTTTTTPITTSQPSEGSTGSSHSSLSSGAIAGIVVSIIALVVALTVAGYVYLRRKKEREQREADEIYKYGDDQRTSYMEVPLPQYTGMIQPTLPPLPNITNLRVTNPDNDDEEANNFAPPFHHEHTPSFEVKRNSSPGWRRGSFDDD